MFAIDSSTALRVLHEDDARELFLLTDDNREHLRRWLPWLDVVTREELPQVTIRRAIVVAVLRIGRLLDRLATFAADGPEFCSGLPVARYSSADLAHLLGNRFELLETRREEHITPDGGMQPFIWVAGRMGPERRR